jgi:diaminopimelate decarboxylase
VHYAVKANSNRAVLRHMKAQGFGVDIVSGGELKAALTSGFKGKDIVFSGVGKTDDELTEAVKKSVDLINVESSSEWYRLQDISRKLKKTVRVGLRVHPDVSAQTHPHIDTAYSASKFGVSMDEASKLAVDCEHLKLAAVSFHVGSQLMNFSPVLEAYERTEQLCRKLNVFIPILDIGGGVGVDYAQPELAPRFSEYAETVRTICQRWTALQASFASSKEKPRVYVELGRCLVAQAGILVTRVVAIKESTHRRFVVVDAGMNDFLRPALYQARHPFSVAPLSIPPGSSAQNYDVVGPICESADVFARDVRLPILSEGDVLTIGMTGAYGRVMASHYNGRPLPAEWWHGRQPKLSQPFQY